MSQEIPTATSPDRRAELRSTNGKRITMALLDGIKVIDFSRLFAGPFATQMLVDMGAEVIKVEHPGDGDVARSYGVGDGDTTESSSFLALNRGKQSIEIDLKTNHGLDAAKALIAEADVVIENFRPDVMNRLGLGYEEMAKINERLVYCSISGFGSTGPLRNKAANDLIIQAFSGLLSVTGEPGGKPVRAGTAIADLSTGVFAALGIVSALYERERSGLGQKVVTSLLASQLSMMNFVYADYWVNGIVAKPLGTANRLGLPNQAFPTTDGGVVIAATSDLMWRRCSTAIGAAHLADDPRFRSLPDRYTNRDELVAEVTSYTEKMTTAECLAALEAQGVSSGPINTIPQVASDPQVAAIDILRPATTRAGKQTTVVGFPIQFSRSEAIDVRETPELGEHTESVLSAIAERA